MNEPAQILDDFVTSSHRTQTRFFRENGEAVVTLAVAIAERLRAGGKILLFGNGGSAADAQHLAAELVGRFVPERPALPAMSLTTDTSVLTAVANDYGYERLFARQIEAHGREGDVAIALSTSGTSPNVLAGIEVAGRLGLYTIGFTGESGGKLNGTVDVLFRVPSTDTPRIQETHILLGHCLFELVDRQLFPEAYADVG